MELGLRAYDVGPFFGKVDGVRLEFNTALAAVQDCDPSPTPSESAGKE